MLTSFHGASPSEPRYRLSEIADGQRIEDYIYEIVAGLPDNRLETVFADIAHFEMTGKVSDEVHSVLRRATCLADADAMLRRL